jgi:hypothetical protein
VAVVPRLRDTLRVHRLDESSGVLFAIFGGDEELFRLTPDGWHLLTLLDGVSPEADVLAAYHRHVGREMEVDELHDFCAALRDAGALNEGDRAIRTLSYLRSQDVTYRTARPDRRSLVHPDAGSPDDPRAGDRRGDDRRDLRFEVGIAHLNDGRLEQGLATFRALSADRPADVRVGEIIGHLEFLEASEANPNLLSDRRDPAWDAFDRVLVEMLGEGRCPACEAPIRVALYRANRCDACGASFTATAMRREDGRRRVEDT